jgi:translation initiation factor IF-1
LEGLVNGKGAGQFAGEVRTSPVLPERKLGVLVSSTIYSAITTRFMPTEDSIVTEGKIVTVLPGTMFRVELSNQHLVLAHISGKMRKKFIRLTVGDRVKLEMSPYDLGKARIVYRLG